VEIVTIPFDSKKGKQVGSQPRSPFLENLGGGGGLLGCEDSWEPLFCLFHGGGLKLLRKKIVQEGKGGTSA